MARAVIRLQKDISPALPLLHRQIKGCAYNPDKNLAAFNVKGMAVNIQPRQITIYNPESETVAREIMKWLEQILRSPDGQG